MPSFLPGNNPSKNGSDDKVGKPNEITLPINLKRSYRSCAHRHSYWIVVIIVKFWRRNGRSGIVRNKRKKDVMVLRIVMMVLKNVVVVDNESQSKQEDNENKQLYVLCRKRYHNFTKNVMAHEFLAYHCIDRFYHKGTMRFQNYEIITTDTSRP